MPSSGYTLEGETLYEQTRPPVRRVEYDHDELDQDRAMMTMTTVLRSTWLVEPQPDPNNSSASGEDAVSVFLGPQSRRINEGREDEIPSNPDRETIHTPWRDGVYQYLCHVFVDAFAFLAEAAGEEKYGHHHVSESEHEVFGLGFEREEVEDRSWDTNVMLLPAYLAPGVTVKMFRVREGDASEQAFGQFDHEKPFITWFVRAGVSVRCVVEKAEDANDVDGLAAVMLVGRACARHAVDNGEERPVEEIDVEGNGEVGEDSELRAEQE